jgi:hypothetical protein
VIKNMANSIDMIYFQELAEQDTKDVCRRALCKYDDENKFYALSVWGDEYAIYPHEVKKMLTASYPKNCWGAKTENGH